MAKTAATAPKSEVGGDGGVRRKRRFKPRGMRNIDIRTEPSPSTRVERMGARMRPGDAGDAKAWRT